LLGSGVWQSDHSWWRANIPDEEARLFSRFPAETAGPGRSYWMTQVALPVPRPLPARVDLGVAVGIVEAGHLDLVDLRGVPVRTFAILLLAGLLTGCPLLCGWGAAGMARHCCEDEAGPEGPLPAPCPDDGVCCACAGAVHPDEVVVPGPDTYDLSSPFDLTFASTFRTHLQALEPHDGDTGRVDTAPAGPPSSRCALLQRFRC
jgi:hypothetical protein